MINHSKLTWVIFGLMAIAQLAVPIWMIWGSKMTANEGKLYKFELDVVDPADPFRGKYIVLEPKKNGFHINTDQQKHADKMYASFTTDARGFAAIESLAIEPPAHVDYLTVKVSGWLRKAHILPVTIHYPFDRYYMNEHKAKPAEDLVRASTRDSLSVCYAEVYIHKGQALVSAVKVDGVPIEHLVTQ